MKKQFIIGSLVFTSILQTASVAHADKSDIGTIIGGVIGGVVGSGVGKGNGNKAAIIIGAVAGSLIGNRLGREMDNSDRRALEEAQRRSLEGGMNQNCDWDGRNYGSRTGARGRFTSTREGYNARTGEYCREYESSIYLQDRVETNRGIACQSRDGSWYESRQSEVQWGRRDDYGRPPSRPAPGPRPGDGYGRPERPNYPPPPPVQRYEEASVQVSSVTRRTGGEWIRVTLNNPIAIEQLEVRALTAGVRVHDAMVYTASGRQFPVRQFQGTGTLYAGDRLGSENLNIRDRVTTIDLRMESMGGYADVLVRVMSMDGYPSLNVSRY
ncbi:MAG: beta-sandwich domain-containing protein [Bdellovibrio sp.]|nr:beta-sandwich domain-containing protein [Bdellovibrio sp.]